MYVLFKFLAVFDDNSQLKLLRLNTNAIELWARNLGLCK